VLLLLLLTPLEELVPVLLLLPSKVLPKHSALML
jgi:hypothetical protein